MAVSQSSVHRHSVGLTVDPGRPWLESWTHAWPSLSQEPPSLVSDNSHSASATCSSPYSTLAQRLSHVYCTRLLAASAIPVSGNCVSFTPRNSERKMSAAIPGRPGIDSRESIPYMFPHPYPKTDHGLHSYSSRHFPFKQTINVTAAIASMQKYTITDRHLLI